MQNHKDVKGLGCGRATCYGECLYPEGECPTTEKGKLQPFAYQRQIFHRTVSTLQPLQNYFSVLLTVQWRKQNGCLSRLPGLFCHVSVCLWQFIIQPLSALCPPDHQLSFYHNTHFSVACYMFTHLYNTVGLFLPSGRLTLVFSLFCPWGLWQGPPNLFLVLVNWKNERIIKHNGSDLFKFPSSLVVDSRLKLELRNFHLMLLLVDILTASLRPHGHGEGEYFLRCLPLSQ